MLSSDFREITIKSDAQKAERLFRAAVSAFCSLPRPSRRDIAQLEDLTLPLFDLVSVAAKRFVAAALSECTHAPIALVQRLCSQSIDIAAPLLIRSTALGDIDLIALIARHGYGHARAIGRRSGLNPAIARLVALIEKKVVPLSPAREAPAATRATLPQEAAAAQDHASGPAAEEARRRLRAMMLPAATQVPALKAAGRSIYDRLRESALSGHPAFFQTALADALDKDFAAVHDAFADESYAWLLDALCVLGVADEKAFLVTAAVYPALFGDLQAIRLFLLRYAAISREEASGRIGRWNAELSSPVARPGPSETRVAG